MREEESWDPASLATGCPDRGYLGSDIKKNQWGVPEDQCHMTGSCPRVPISAAQEKHWAPIMTSPAAALPSTHAPQLLLLPGPASITHCPSQRDRPSCCLQPLSTFLLLSCGFSVPTSLRFPCCGTGHAALRGTWMWSPQWSSTLPRVCLSRVGVTGQAERLLHSQPGGLGPGTALL